MILYKSKFLEVNFLELQYLMHINWMNYAGYMDKEGVYHEFINFLNNRIYKRANQIYVDWREVEHLVSQETIDWFFEYILPKIASHKPYKMAFLLSDISKIGVLDKIKVNNTQITLKLFTQPDELMEWLMQGAERKESGQDDHDHHHSCEVE